MHCQQASRASVKVYLPITDTANGENHEAIEELAPFLMQQNARLQRQIEVQEKEIKRLSDGNKQEPTEQYPE